MTEEKNPNTKIGKKERNAYRWAAMMRDPGLALEVKPASGVLAGQSQVELTVRVYSDCWGLYRDQIMIQIESLEPIILDVWVEILGAPLYFPAKRPDGDSPVLWMSASDPTRKVRARNASRSRLYVHAYVICEHADSLPGESDIETKSTSFSEEMDTGIELYLAEDYGVQDDQYYKVEPEVCTVDPNAFNSWTVTLMSPGHGELAPNSMILLRCLPLDTFGDSWYRPDPAPQLVYLKQTVREGQLRLSCREVIAKLSALDLPFGDVLRIRKRFRIQNVGNGPLNVTAETEAPWRIVQEDRQEHGLPCGTGCGCYQRATRKRLDLLPLHLEPRSSLEMCVEVCCDAAEIWPTTAGAPPCQPPSYPPRRRTVTPLVFRDGDNLLAVRNIY
ncbi:uncharacterized protein LOC131841361 [Achroia grisella]|uniref:uncharacterized protein LOC131841361 n=1 Tax=Achroia grisella TaxID=688607 RepID=UPI0027D236D1|nr:uncharacterized protein LOC131841361 [Achroia grisella]